MTKSTPPDEEVVANKLIEYISQIKNFALGEGAATCQVCGQKLREGAPITAYAFRPAGTPTYQLGCITCAEQHEPLQYYTLGVRELVVDGRIGRCYDVATQSSWLVLLAPECHTVSPANTRWAYELPTDTRPRLPAGPSVHTHESATESDSVDVDARARGN